MVRFIPRQVHGILDYLYAILVAATPHLFGFTDLSAPRFLAYGLGALVLSATLLTRAEWGVVRVIPYRVHLLLDGLTGVLVVASPWILGFGESAAARNTFVVAGLTAIAASLLSKTDEMPSGNVRAVS